MKVDEENTELKTKKIKKKKNNVEEQKKITQNDNEKLKNNKNFDIKNETYIINKNKRNKRIIITICILVGILLIGLIFSTIFALININSTKIISGITINGLDVQKLTIEEATQKLNEITEEKLNTNITIKEENFEYEVQLSQIEVTYEIDQAIEEAYNIGRDGNIFYNNYIILKNMINGTNIELQYSYNEELLDNIVNDMNSKVPNPVTQANYCIEDETLIISKGVAGEIIDTDTLKNQIVNEILNNEKVNEINIEFMEKEPDSIDIEKIYNEVYTEAQDAYYTEDPFQIYPEVNGVNFDLEVAKEILQEDKDEYEIPLIITVPDVTLEDIGTEAFTDLLSSFSTKYDASNTSRTTNLKIAMNKLDGVVVGVGETFSYNQTLGKRTAEAGYQEANGYSGGKVVKMLAGGICQISSTLYDAVVYANLEIVERHNHMFLPGYVGAGKDATVVYGSLDFQFKNTRNYPVMIKTNIGNGVATVYIYGIKEEVEYDVDIETSILSYTAYSTEYKNDSSLSEGTQVVTQSGMNGCKSITYKVLKLNGVEVSRSVLSSDTYDPLDKVVSVGTKKTSSTSTSSASTEKETATASTSTNTTNSTNTANTNTTKNNTNDT